MLEQVDLSITLDRESYQAILPEVQLALLILQQRMRATGTPAVILYEGWDAAGKGGSILRITEKLDPRGYVVHPIGAPNEVERQYHYLWRFWTRLPRAGNSSSSIGAGTAACWWSGWSTWRSRRSGAGRTARFANSSACWWMPAPC